MRIIEITRTLLGASVVYVVMAACGSDNTGSGAGRSDGRDAGLADALVNPVPEAAAQTDDAQIDAAAPQPGTFAEPCDKMVAPQGATTYVYAEHLFPGRTKAELSRITGYGHLTEPVQIPGYEDFTLNVIYVRDGAVAFLCGVVGNLTFDAITFVDQ